MKTSWRAVFGICGGVVVALPALLLAVASAGGGHGNYVFAKAFFPYTMLLTRLAADTITAPLIGLALLQFPAYGLTSALHRPGMRLIGIAALALAHTAAAVACFSGILPNFS